MAESWLALPETPAFVVNLGSCRSAARRIASAFRRFSTTTLFAVKACNIPAVLNVVKQDVQGFSVSSLYEARLARDLGCSKCLIHYVSPLLNSVHVHEIVHRCDRLTLNSLSQLDRFGAQLHGAIDLGIRVNPDLSFTDDARYDPCRRNSKLGVPLHDLAKSLRDHPEQMSRVRGIHFHSNCDSNNICELLATIRRVESVLGAEFQRFKWLNVGGGYQFATENEIDQLGVEFRRMSEQHGLEVVIEPGAAIVRSAGSFVSTVEDIVKGVDYPIAILDTTVNHWPEVFEYQFEPEVVGHVEEGLYRYLLAGCSCLAGDLFGVYSFNEPLEVGSRVVFANAGAYSIVKAHMFNGIDLPTIYAVTEGGELVRKQSFSYEDFASRCGVNTDAVV